MKTKFSKKERIQIEALRRLSRRDFMSQGLKASGAMVSFPWMIRTLFHETTAFAEIVNGGVATYPVVQIHLPGGWGGAIVPLDRLGNPLSGSALSRYGVQPDIMSQSGRIQPLFGLQFFDKTLNPTTTPLIEFTQGLIQKLPNPNPSNIQAFTVANDGQDDNNTNPIGVNSVLLSAGFKASLVDAVGMSRTTTGMTNSSVLSEFRSTPLIAPTPTDLQNLFAYAPALAGRPENQLANFAGALRAIGDMQAPKILGSTSNSDQLIQGVSAAHAENMKFTVPNTVNIDATQDIAYSDAFLGLFTAGQALSANPQLAAFATGVKGLLGGYINFVGYSLPFGYDYHGQNILDAGNNLGTLSRDRIAGQMLGILMNLALAANKNMIIVLSSDGACQGKPDHTLGSDGVNTNLWTGDRGQQNLLHFYAISGAGSIPSRANGIQQVGAMRNDTGTVDTSTLSGKGDMAAASVIAANILHLNGVSPDSILKIFPAFSSTATLMDHIVLRVS